MSDDPRVLKHGARDEKVIALTIDDGWYEDPRLTDLLRDAGVSATVFVVGQVIHRAPAWIRMLRDDGHEFGNHTWSHPHPDKVSMEIYLAQVRKTDDLLFDTLGIRTRFFRPPYGLIDSSLADALDELELRPVLWDCDLQGYWDRQIPEEQLQRLREGLQGGMIILSHFGERYNTYEVLRSFIPEARAAGYRFVTLSEMFGL